MNYQECQRQLIDVISRIERNSQDLKQSLEGKTDISLLVGDTGCGKSTIFNLLCGAEFEMRKENNIECFCIKKGSKNYSVMKHGTKSVTTEPIYFYNQELNHLLIDFPGFRDTRGEIEELVIQLLFNKIVTKNKVRLVYIIQQPLITLSNRGTLLQKFIKIFEDQKIKFSECFLILNSFSQDNIEEKALIQNIKDELMSITNDNGHTKQNMFVIRIFNQQRLTQIQQIRQNLWSSLVKQNTVIFSPFHIHKLQIISKYLDRVSRTQLSDITQFFKMEVEGSIQTMSEEDVLKLQTILQSFKLDNQSPASHYQRLFQIHEELSLLFKVNKQQTMEQQMEFLKIFRFFEGYKDSIESYQNCVDALIQINNHTKLLSKYIDQRLNNQKLEKERIRELKQQQEQFKQMHDQMTQQFEQKLNQVREEQSKISEQDLAIYKLQSEKELALMNQQLQFEKEKQNQVDKNAIFENTLKMIALFIPLIEKKVGISQPNAK